MARPTSLVRFHLLMGSICLLVVGSSLAVLLLVLLPSQQRSDAAQHGTRATATVVTVTQHSGRAAQTDITVRLAEPPGLAGKTSIVHVSGLNTYRTGTTLTVTVDNADTGYAELPGQPMETIGQVLVEYVVLGIVSIAFVVLWMIMPRRIRRAQRARLDAGAA